jgi:hypothetical protein
MRNRPLWPAQHYIPTRTPWWQKRWAVCLASALAFVAGMTFDFWGM